MNIRRIAAILLLCPAALFAQGVLEDIVLPSALTQSNVRIGGGACPTPPTIIYNTTRVANQGAEITGAANGPLTCMADLIVLDAVSTERSVCEVEVDVFTLAAVTPFDLTMEFYTACTTNGVAGSACGTGPGTLIPGSTVTVTGITPPALGAIFSVVFPYPAGLDLSGEADNTVSVKINASRSDVFWRINETPTVGTIPAGEPATSFVERCGSAANNNGCQRNFGVNNNFGMTIRAVEGTQDADLSITKTNGVASSTPGTDTTYTIVASNAGPTPVIGATVTDTFPAACTAVSWSCVAAGGATCTAGPTAGNINDLIDLPVGGTATYSAVCSIAASAVGTLVNTATITEPGSVTDPDQTNNSATDTDTLVASADVSIIKTAAAVDPVVIGSTITFTLTASNAGPSDATAVTVTDALPANVTYVSNTCGATFAAPTVTWNIATLAAGASLVCDIVVTVNNFGPISNTATITAAGDPNGANNSSTVVLGGVPFPADVAITISAAPAGGLAVGDTFVYTVTGTNNGPGDATGLLFNLTLSNKLSFVSSDCGAVLTGNVVSWSVPTLANGASTSCQVTVAVVLGGDITSSATVSTTTVDPNLSNNSATITVGFDAVPVPTLDRLGLLLAGLLLLGLGLVAMRRF